MAKKSKKNNKKIIWISLIAVAILFVLLLIFGIFNKATAPINPSLTIYPSIPPFTTYHSDFLDATVDVPTDYSIKEVYGLQELNLEKKGKIIIVHVFGTNRAYKNIKEFLNDIDNQSYHSKESNSQPTSINGLDCEIVLTKYTNKPEINNKAYNCFINSNVFAKISTTSESLYSDLDQIAKSFRYEPKPTP